MALKKKIICFELTQKGIISHCQVGREPGAGAPGGPRRRQSLLPRHVQRWVGLSESAEHQSKCVVYYPSLLIIDLTENKIFFFAITCVIVFANI